MGGLLPAEREDLARDFEVLRLHRESDPDGLLRERQRDIVGLITWITNPVSRALIEALPNLEIIGRVGAGVDNIDLEVARARGIVVVNTPDLVTADTADLAMGLIVALLRRTVEADAWVRVGKWRGGAMPLGASLTGKRLGIVGLGRIGQALARRAQAFDMTVLYHGPRRKPDAPYRYVDDLCALAAQSDVLALTCPGGPATAGLVGEAVLKALGPKGFLVNVARGSVVEEEALLAALASRTIAGAGLDVFRDEPNVPEALFSFDNVVLLPHIGTATLETRSKMGQYVISNLRAHFEGRPVPSVLKAAGG